MVKGAFAPEDPLSFEHWMDSFGTVALAYSSYSVMSKFGNSLRAGRATTVSNVITNDILESPRTESALKIDDIKPIYEVDPATGRSYIVQEFPGGAQSHGFNSIIDNYAGFATQTPLSNATLYQLDGALNGIAGRFEWIIQDGSITHRMFIQGGKMNGVPIIP